MVGKVWLETMLINLSLLDTKSARVIERESRSVQGSLDRLVEETGNAAKFLVRSLLEGKQGDVIVKSSENNAEIEVDGKLVGLSPMPRLKMASGPHTLRVSKKGFVVYAKDVIVSDKELTVLDAQLVPSMEFISNYDGKANTMRYAAYATFGVGAAAVATGFILWYGYNDPRNNKHNAAKDALDKAGNATTAQETGLINNEAGFDFCTIYTVSQIVGIVGGVAMATGIVLFFSGPETRRVRSIQDSRSWRCESDLCEPRADERRRVRQHHREVLARRPAARHRFQQNLRPTDTNAFGAHPIEGALRVHLIRAHVRIARAQIAQRR